MKKIVALLLAFIMIFAFATVSFAATGDSPEKPGKTDILKAEDKNGTDITDKITTKEDDSVKELTDDVIKEVLGDDYKKDATPISSEEIIYDGDDYPITVTVSAPSVKTGDDVYVLAKTESGWEKVKATAGNGTITFTLSNDGVIAFVAQSKQQTSPQTGYPVAAFAVMALVALAGAAYATKRCFNA